MEDLFLIPVIWTTNAQSKLFKIVDRIVTADVVEQNVWLCASASLHVLLERKKPG